MITALFLSSLLSVKFLKPNRSQARQMTSLLTGQCHLKGYQTGYNIQSYLWEVLYGNRNTLAHPP